MVADAFSELPLWVNVLIFMQQYSMYLYPTILIGGAIGFLRMFTMPLITRTPQELIVMLGPGKAKIIKVTNRYLPFFIYRRGLYWFSQPIEIGHNLVHLYFEGINQPITALDRNGDKEADILAQREFIKQTKSHTVYIPVSMKVFSVNWALILKEVEGEDGTKKHMVKLVPSKELKIKGRAQYRIGFFKRIGIYMATEQVAEGSNASDSLQTLTVQTVMSKLGAAVKGTNFSSVYAAKILKATKKIERDWIMMLTGAFDMRIIIVLMITILAIVAVFLLFKPGDISSLGPAPPGVHLTR